MWRWAQGRLSSLQLVWKDADDLQRRFGEAAFGEASLRASDPRGNDDMRSRGHWIRVARIIGWRTGQDAEPPPAPARSLGRPRPRGLRALPR